jgi:IMP dehydrogenase
LPARSDVVPAQTDTRTWITRKIGLNIPIVSSAMDTVTESHLAIALAQQGGLGLIHRSMDIGRQAEEVDKVKRSESGMIVDPVTVDPEQPIGAALEVMKRFRISGVPVTKDGKLVGILTNRDLRFETRFDQPISSVMTKENLITVGVGTTLEEAEAILHQHRVEKLLVVDELYDAVVVRPLALIARGCWKIVDTIFINGSVHVGAFLVELTGDLGRFSTTGNVRNYALYFFLGVVALFWWLLS